MNRSGPLTLIVTGFVLFVSLLVPFVVQRLPRTALPVDVRETILMVAPSVAPLVGVLGTALVLMGVVWLLMLLKTEKDFFEYEADLSRLASEFGKKLWIKPPLGIGFSSGTGGVKVDIRVNPHRGFVLVYADCAPHAKFYAMDRRQKNRVPRGWHRGGGGEGWEMFATSKSAAKQLYSDFGYREAMTEMFETLNLKIIRHDEDGIEFVADLVPPGRAEAVIRRALRGVYWLAENNVPKEDEKKKRRA